MPNNYGNSIASVVNAYNQVVTINSTTLLAATSYNRTYSITGAYTVTLPLISAGAPTYYLLFLNDTTSATALIAAQGSDNIRLSGVNVTSVSLYPGDSVMLESNGASWSLGTTSFVKANLASPTFSGTPSAPTAAPGTSTTQLATTGFVQTALSAFSTLPVGSLVMTLGSSAPAGTMKMNGASISRSTYSALFSVIGTTYGVGDGSTTFVLPNPRGYFPRFADDGMGIDVGRTIGSLQSGSYAAHSHTMNDPGHAHGVYDPGHSHGGVGFPENPDDGSYSVANGTGTHRDYSGSTYGSGTGIGISGSSTGVWVNNSGGSETRPINMALLACIKY